jgi:hypothetical protein
MAEGEGWREERTGMHEREFIETRRHWFTAPVTHHTQGGVNVLNLVEGDEAIVDSPSGAFAPLSSTMPRPLSSRRRGRVSHFTVGQRHRTAARHH